MTTTEDQILQLMNEQSALVAAGQAGSPRHQAGVKQLIELIDAPLRAAFEGRRRGLEQAGLQYTEMVHDFFLKLLQGRVEGKQSFTTFQEQRALVATVIQNQFRDALRVTSNRQRILAGLAAEAEKKRKYFEERYRTPFLDFLIQIEEWEQRGSSEQKLAARVLRFRYVTGEAWERIAEEFGIADRECRPQRELARHVFGGR